MAIPMCPGVRDRWPRSFGQTERVPLRVACVRRRSGCNNVRDGWFLSFSIRLSPIPEGASAAMRDRANLLRRSERLETVFDGEGNSVAVLRSACERLENQHVESSGHEVGFFRHGLQCIDYLWIECQW